MSFQLSSLLPYISIPTQNAEVRFVPAGRLSEGYLVIEGPSHPQSKGRSTLHVHFSFNVPDQGEAAGTTSENANALAFGVLPFLPEHWVIPEVYFTKDSLGLKPYHSFR